MTDSFGPTHLLYATAAYEREFDGRVVAVGEEGHAVALSQTSFFPTGGGQPHDTGTLALETGHAAVVGVAKGHDGVVWHAIAQDVPLPSVGTSAHGTLDWDRRHLLMRTHTALHVLNGIIWLDHGAQVTGAHMTPGEGRLDFELPAMSQELRRAVEERVNEQIRRDLPCAWCTCRARRPTETSRSSGSRPT